MEMRDAAAGDRAGIAGIIEGAGNLTREEKDCAHELLDIYLGSPAQRDYSFIAALEAGRVIGYICYGRRPLADRVFDLYWIIVHPDWRGKGAGTALLKHMEGFLRREGGGARLILAETSGVESYGPARSFYLKNGFCEEARIKDFYKQGDDIIVYVKRL